MIPLKLNMKNFLCYGEGVPTLDFQGINLACLCGQNGHGKTAILEAITWSLWGKGRAQTQQEFVRIGQKSMSVELEFACRDEKYRVIRTFSKPRGTGAGKTSLEIQILGSSTLRPITDNTISETQKKIDRILNMDYGTFINTSYLKQGEADIFATSKPSERKQILANILSLSSYDAYEAESKKLSSGFDNSVAGHMARITLKKQEAESFGNINGNLKDIDAELLKLSTIIDTEKAGIDKLTRIQSLTNSIVFKESQNKELQTQLSEYNQRIQKNQEIISKQAEINKGYGTLRFLRTEFGEYGKLNGEHRNLDHRKSTVIQSISHIKATLSVELANINKKIETSLEPKAQSLPEVTELLQTLTESLSSIDSDQQNTMKTKVIEKDGFVSQANRLTDINKRLEDEIKDIHKKFVMLESDKPICPLCDQELNHVSHTNLREDYENQGKIKLEELKRNKGKIDALSKQRISLERLIDGIKASHSSAFQEIQNKISDLTAQKHLCVQATEELLSENNRRKELQSSIENETFANNDFAQLKSIEQQLQSLNFDPLKYETLNTEIGKYLRFDSMHAELVSAKDSLSKDISSSDRVKTQLGQISDETTSWTNEKSSLMEQITKLYKEPAVAIDLPSAQNRLDKKTTQQQEVLVQKGIAQANIKKLEQLLSDTAVLEKEISSIAENKTIYDELSVAFGKNGVQALIIEEALPRLQEHSDHFLKQLTDGKLSVKFQLIQGKKGANWKLGIPSEELEILISDELGTRSYETYSGGESFRINFSIRIALSQLLANRSGVVMPILFIDEGFGSQDRTGQELLIEILQTIKTNFDKILVVTHIEEIKEAFPTRIEVEKTDAGSSFTVI